MYNNYHLLRQYTHNHVKESNLLYSLLHTLSHDKTNRGEWLV